MSGFCPLIGLKFPGPPGTMARLAIERDRTPWPTPRTADFPPPNARSARRAPKDRWRVRVTCRTWRRSAPALRCWRQQRPELMAWLAGHAGGRPALRRAATGRCAVHAAAAGLSSACRRCCWCSGMGALLLALAVASACSSGGWNFTLKALQPKFDKIDPLAGLGRMFSAANSCSTR